MNRTSKAMLLIASIGIIALSAMPASAIYVWEQVNEEGFGDLTNDYAWSMHEYDGYLYVGTLNTNVSEPPNPMTDGLEIWRSLSGDYGSWEQVVGSAGNQSIIRPSGLILPAKAGFRSFCIGARGMKKHGNLLWVGTSNPVTGCQIWVTNGTHWKLANVPGFNNPNNMATRGITVFNGRIYAEAQNADDGAEVWRYTGSTDFDLINPVAWERVVAAGFGEPDHNKGIGELVVFDPPDDGTDTEYLYAGTWAITVPSLVESGLEGKGCEVWRSPDGDNWEEVIGDELNYGIGRGFGNLDNNAVLSSKVFGDYLYMGTQNWIDAAEIWRTGDGTTWEPVTVNGFGHLNGYMWRMHEHNDTLLVGTFNPICGCEIWESSTGAPGDFEQVNRNGMNGNPLQYGARSFETFNGSLYVGTASFGSFVDGIISIISPIPTSISSHVGCEVWRTDGTTCAPPDVEVIKTVWNPEIGDWVDRMDAPLGDSLTFRCEIRNDGQCNLTDIMICDFMSRSLEYAGSATIEPDDVTNYCIGTKLTWNLTDTTLQPGESVVIKYNANVVQCDRMDVNFLFAGGCCEDTECWGGDWGIAIVKGICPAPVSVPAMTPIGIAALVGLLGLIGACLIVRRR